MHVSKWLNLSISVCFLEKLRFGNVALSIFKVIFFTKIYVRSNNHFSCSSTRLKTKILTEKIISGRINLKFWTKCFCLLKT